MTLFVDTSAFFAVTDRSDRHHAQARSVLGSGDALVTSEHVLVETWLLIRRQMDRATAERFWEALREGATSVESVTGADLEAAWTIGALFPDQDFSIVDRTSFALMERLGLTRVATFDRHFAVYRYGRERRRAFEIVR